MNVTSSTQKEDQQNFKSVVITASFVGNGIVFLSWLIYMTTIRTM